MKSHEVDVSVQRVSRYEGNGSITNRSMHCQVVAGVGHHAQMAIALPDVSNSGGFGME